MAPGNSEQMVHYQDTIKNRVKQDRILKYLSSDTKNILREVFGNQSVPIWGSRNSPANRSRFEKMRIGDNVLIVEGKRIKLLGKIACKVISPIYRQSFGKISGGTRKRAGTSYTSLQTPLRSIFHSMRSRSSLATGCPTPYGASRMWQTRGSRVLRPI